MKVWIKLVKYYSSRTKTDYMLVEKSEIDTHDKEQELMENWGENSEGGHNYGYRVEMFELKRKELPPLEWVEMAIKRTEDEIEYKKKSIENYNKLLIDLQLVKTKLL